MSCMRREGLTSEMKVESVMDELWQQASEERRKGNWLVAIERYTRLIEVAPECAPAYVERGLLDLELGHRDRAALDFQRALELEPKYGLAYYGRGWLRHLAGDFEGELQDALLGLQLDPGHAGLHYRRLGSAYQGLGQYENAIDTYSRAFQLAGATDHATLYNRGKCYLEMHAYEAALADFDRCLELDPGWGWTFAARALTYLEIGDFERAIADSDRAIRFQPDYLVSFLTRGLACQALGMTQHARRNFQYVLRTTRDAGQRNFAARNLQNLRSGSRQG